jgi:hypothetical protein
LGVWDAGLRSAQRSSMGVGAVRRIRTAPTQQPNNARKRAPPGVDGATGYCFGKILMKEAPTWDRLMTILGTLCIGKSI